MSARARRMDAGVSAFDLPGLGSGLRLIRVRMGAYEAVVKALSNEGLLQSAVFGSLKTAKSTGPEGPAAHWLFVSGR